MINNIVKTFYILAKEHKLIRSFKYERLSKGAGIGEENYPQVFLEDPIYISDSTLTDGSVKAEVNFDIVMTPQAFENYHKRQLTEQDCQNIAHTIALSFISRLNNMDENYDLYEDKNLNRLTPLTWNFVTLRHWYDNDAAGVRCTLLLSMDNPINLCDVEENFDEDKSFDLDSKLSKIDTNDANGCTNFDYKLPKFTL